MIKRFKKGFTLAEVLITLSVIGVVAAIVMPGVISNYQYKTIGVKLSKFASSVENSSRAYVAQNDSFASNEDVMNFVNDSFIIKSISNVTVGEDGSMSENAYEPEGDLLTLAFGREVDAGDYPNYYTVPADNLGELPDFINQSGNIAMLKDNTSITISMVAREEFANHVGVVDSHKVGLPIFNINFDTHAAGLPSTVQKTYNFVVTELGFVYPNDNDLCLWDIYNDDWNTKTRTYAVGSNCNTGAQASSGS